MLQEKDLVLSVEGIPYGDSESIRALVADRAGSTVAVEIIRNGEQMTIETKPTKLDLYRDPGLILTLTKDFGSVLARLPPILGPLSRRQARSEHVVQGEVGVKRVWQALLES